MILMLLLQIVLYLFDIIFALLPNIPTFDSTILNPLMDFVDLIFDNTQVLGFFIDINLIQKLLPWLIIVINFEHIYHFALWILKKIPILNIHD